MPQLREKGNPLLRIHDADALHICVHQGYLWPLAAPAVTTAEARWL